MTANEELHNRLIAKHGKAVQIRGAEARRILTLHGIDAEPGDVLICTYRDRAAAEAYAESNKVHYGHPSLGIFTTEAGVIGITDLRPALHRFSSR